MESIQSAARRIYTRIFGLTTRQKIKIGDHAMLLLNEVGGSSDWAIHRAAGIFGVRVCERDRGWINGYMKTMT